MAKVVINGQELELDADALTSLLSQVAIQDKAMARKGRDTIQVKLNEQAKAEAAAEVQRKAQVSEAMVAISNAYRKALASLPSSVWETIISVYGPGQFIVSSVEVDKPTDAKLTGSWEKKHRASSGGEAHSSAGSQRPRKAFGGPQKVWDAYSKEHATAQELTDYASGDKNRIQPAKSSLYDRLVAQGILK